MYLCGRLRAYVWADDVISSFRPCLPACLPALVWPGLASPAQGAMTLNCAQNLFSAPPVAAVVFAVVLVSVGQFLNFKVYQLLQHDGIFYGCRFGISVPWVTAFPYSHIRDPQYVRWRRRAAYPHLTHQRTRSIARAGVAHSLAGQLAH